MKYSYAINVVVPIPIDGFFTYSLSKSEFFKIKIGSRVIVSFGKKKYYTAVVFEKHENYDVDYELKEISYMHSEGFPGGEMKHGPIALIDKNSITVCLIPNNDLFEKSLSNAQEISARNGKIIILSSLKNLSKINGEIKVINMPKENIIDTPFIYTIPIQLISYYFALSEGTDIDQPRNLAKSVTVE